MQRDARVAWIVVLIGIAGSAVLVSACDDEPADKLAFGEPCAEDTECESEMCAAVGRCTQECDASTPCPDSRTCGEDGACVLPNPPVTGTLKVGYLYVGPVGDHGWTKAHDDGRQYIEDHMDDVELHYSPSIAPDDASAEIESFIEQGDNVIIGTSFDFLTSLQSAANNNPDVNFLTCSGFQTGPNMGSYFGRMEQVMYLLGIVAGSVTETDRIGIVGPVVIPETVRLNNAFTRGVRASNPEAVVIVRWVGAWFNPDEETAASQELIDGGVDIVYGHTDTTIPMEYVRDNQPADRTVYTFGYDNPDSCHFAPDICISSGYWNWGPVVTRILTAMREGEWVPSEIIYDSIELEAEESMIYYSPINEDIVEAGVIQQVEGLVEQMAEDDDEGRYLPFLGPVTDAEGDERYAEGDHPTDDDLLNMCWYVEGMSDTDELPNEAPAECTGDR
jgi:basic membrane protein A